MRSILLCSSNPLLIKSLYVVLRDGGYAVELVEHPSLAVQKVINGGYDILVVDSEPFGLSAEDAGQIVRSLAPNMHVLYVGGACDRAPVVETPVDLEKFKRTVRNIAA